MIYAAGVCCLVVFLVFGVSGMIVLIILARSAEIDPYDP